MSATAPMIQASRLSKRFGSTLAVDDRSFTVEPGKVTGLLGPNGAGKSTTLHLMLGLVRGGGRTTRPQVRDGYAYLEGTLTSAADSQAGFATVDQLRSRVHAIPGADAKAGGGSAVNLDIQRATRHDTNLVVPLVLLVAVNPPGRPGTE
jgi:ATPase subunit of ABC transporter with duplicated ATPase domains